MQDILRNNLSHVTRQAPVIVASLTCRKTRLRHSRLRHCSKTSRRRHPVPRHRCCYDDSNSTFVRRGQNRHL